MTWHLTLFNDYQATGEACLQVSHNKRDCQLRSWFGPFASQLFKTLQAINPQLRKDPGLSFTFAPHKSESNHGLRHCNGQGRHHQLVLHSSCDTTFLHQPRLQSKASINRAQHHLSDHSFDIEKQFAQYILIQASFNHQCCLHRYQVQQDIKNKGLTFTHQLGELLLYIRMTTQHPSQQTIQRFINSQLPWCDSPDQAINTLLDAQLIQQITYKEQVFYDKNPYPHDHVLNLKTDTLTDYIGQECHQANQLVLI